MTKAGLLDVEFEEEFMNLLKERNWLVHKSRFESRSAIHNDASMQRVMTRIDSIADRVLVPLRKMGALSDAHAKKHGVSEEFIDRKASEILEHWHTEDMD